LLCSGQPWELGRKFSFQKLYEKHLEECDELCMTSFYILQMITDSSKCWFLLSIRLNTTCLDLKSNLLRVWVLLSLFSTRSYLNDLICYQINLPKVHNWCYKNYVPQKQLKNEGKTFSFDEKMLFSTRYFWSDVMRALKYLHWFLYSSYILQKDHLCCSYISLYNN
jgi:hypothetical protein